MTHTTIPTTAHTDPAYSVTANTVFTFIEVYFGGLCHKDLTDSDIAWAVANR